MRNNSNSSAVQATKLIEADPHKCFCGTVVHCEEGCGLSAQVCEAALVFLSTQSIHMSSSATAMNSPAAFDIPLAAISRIKLSRISSRVNLMTLELLTRKPFETHRCLVGEPALEFT